jgi:hypothetical protein
MIINNVEARKRLFKDDLEKCGVAGWESPWMQLPRLVLYERPDKRISWGINSSETFSYTGFRIIETWEERTKMWQIDRWDTWFTNEEAMLRFVVDATVKQVYRHR